MNLRTALLTSNYEPDTISLAQPSLSHEEH